MLGASLGFDTGSVLNSREKKFHVTCIIFSQQVSSLLSCCVNQCAPDRFDLSQVAACIEMLAAIADCSFGLECADYPIFLRSADGSICLKCVY